MAKRHVAVPAGMQKMKNVRTKHKMPANMKYSAAQTMAKCTKNNC